MIRTDGTRTVSNDPRTDLEETSIRVLAGQVVVGDRIAHARTHDFHRVTRVKKNAGTVWLHLERAGRIRPKNETPLWRKIRRDG